MKTCSVDGCDRKSKALGYCPKHYYRLKTHGTTEERTKAAPKRCTFQGCLEIAKARGYCPKHYERLKKHGNAGVVLKNKEHAPKFCTVEGCGNKHNGLGFCDTHRIRFHKYGTPTPEGIKFPSARGEYLSDGVTKTCSTCFVEKGVAEFNKQKVRPDGLDIKCKTCSREFHAKRYKDPEIRRKLLENATRWRERNPDADADKTLRRKYGITLAQYNELFKLQGGVCALCKKSETTRRNKKREGRERLAVDHCHDTGRIRGLLCFKCNTAIGSLGDTEEDARKVVEYFSRPNALESMHKQK